ncbi:hypothetical protein B0H14DRAFT_2573916 [Mycena olivaceomarginata]|nr:hypothetical protein B0H14DRAFT_2573916 [Mycena olivaceomarginata]
MCRHSLPLSAWITMGLVHLHVVSATQGQHDTPIPVYLVAAGHGEIFRPCRVAFALYFPEVHSLPSSAWITMRLIHLHVYLVASGHSRCFGHAVLLLFPEFHNIMVLFDLPTVRCLFLRFILGYWEHLSMGSRGYTELQANTVNTVVEYGQIQGTT